MRPRFRSAARRIASLAFLAYAGATLVLGTAIFFATHAAFSNQIDLRIEQTSRTLAGEFRDDGASGLLEAIRYRRGGGPDALGFAVFDQAGRRIGGDLAIEMPAPGWRTVVFQDPQEGPDPARSLTTVLDGRYRLVVAEDLGSLESIDRTILFMFGLAFAALLFLGFFEAWWLETFLKRRLAAIRTAADLIIGGDLGTRAAIGNRNDEFDLAARSINAMLDRIAELVANLRQVTGDLAHDLRTPLSRLRNQLESLLSAPNESERTGLVHGAIAQSENVLALFDAILRISELEEGSLKRAFGPVELSGLVADLGETFALLAEDSDHELTVTVEPGLVVLGDRELLAQAVINLVENALRHTRDGSQIRLDVRRDGKGAALCVADDGPGIPEAERERVQQRFVRLETARGTAGHGLGLSLVRAIALAHGATLTLGDARPGLVVTLAFAERIEP